MEDGVDSFLLGSPPVSSLTSFSLPISHPFHHQPASAFAPWVAGIAHGPSPLVAHKSSTPLQRGPAPVVGWVTYPPGGLQVESELEDILARLYLYLYCYHTMMQVTNNHKNDNIAFWDFWGIIPINLHIELVCGVCPKHPEANIHSILWKWCNLQNFIQQKQRMVVRLFPLPEKYLGFQCCWRNSNRKRVWWWTICSSWRRTAESMSSHRLRLTFHATCLCYTLLSNAQQHFNSLNQSW